MCVAVIKSGKEGRRTEGSKGREDKREGENTCPSDINLIKVCSLALLKLPLLPILSLWKTKASATFN